MTGLVVGLFVAFLVFLQMRPQQSQTTRIVALEKPAASDTRELGKTEANPTPRDTREDGKAEEKAAPPPPKPRFDFYNLLPEMEVIVPEQEIKGEPTGEGVKRVEEPGTYLLQAGSFRSHEQADQLRAKLALLGLETSVQTVSVNSTQTWHRVRVGPFDNLSDLNKARALLKKNGVDAILIRLKG
jgi:cell division protein FtsN